jgi:hypothetical protein
MKRQAARADKAALRTASKIEKAVADLMISILPLDCISDDYVIEALIDRNPKILDYLNRQRGEAAMMLANALTDWRDKWEAR